MGRFDLEAGSVSLRTLLEFTAAARRVDAEVDASRWLVRPYVAGVEVTKGIQYFWADRHLTNSDDRGPDNSVRLVARKPAWVRVYVRSGLLSASQVLTGDLVVEHRSGPFLGEWIQVATLLPLAPGAVTSQRDPDYATERGTRLSSINFGVGAVLMEGMVRFTARVWPVGDATRTPIDTWQETVDATLLQTLSLRGVFRALQRPRPHDRRGQSAHGRSAGAGAGQSPGDGGVDADDESGRGHPRPLERGADELVRAPHGPAH